MDMRKHLRESNLIEGIDSKKQDKQAEVAWEWLISQRKLTAVVVRTTHKLLTKLQPDLEEKYKGAFRPIKVYVGNHVPPAPALIKSEMTNWLRDYRMWTPQEAHVRFETIHPFVDGNGRTGRMLMWWHERSLGQEPTLLLAEERQKYYQWFKNRGQPFDQTDIFGALAAMRDMNIRDL